MPKTFQDTQGTFFDTREKAAASNTALGTNPQSSSFGTPQNTSVISSESLAPATPLTIPEVPTTNKAATFLNESSVLSALSAQTRADVEAKQQQKDTSLQNLADLFKETQDVTAQRGALEEQAGLSEQNVELADTRNRIDARRQAALKEIDAIRANAQGQSTRGVQSEIARVEREAARELADLYIAESALTRNITALSQNIDRRIELLLSPVKERFEFQKLFFQENVDSLNEAEKREFNLLLNREERELDNEEEKLNTIRDLSLDATQNGAPPNIATKMAQAGTVEEALEIGGQYVGLLNRQYKIAQINKIGYDTLLAQAEASDRKHGLLTEKDIKQIDTSPQGKQLITASNLKLKLSSYQDLVEEFGFEMSGADKAVLENAYIELQLAFKEAANLGVLNGPDLTLVEGAIKSATPGFLGQLGNLLTLGGGTRKLTANLEQAQTTLNSAASLAAEQLYARNPDYENSTYVQSLIIPFGDELITTAERAKMEAIVNQP